MNPFNPTELCGLPSADELHNALLEGENSDARERIALLFDQDTFVETGAYAKRGFSDFFATENANELEGVITGYGAIDGKLVFAFVEDASRMGGMIDERHAAKIANLYALALKNGAPVIGIFNANGTDIFAGTAGLAAYGRILATVSAASGRIPQIALIAGKCIGLSAAIASLFDFAVKEDGASFYVSSPDLIKKGELSDKILAFHGDKGPSAGFIRALVSFLPSNANVGTIANPPTDKLERMLGNVDFGGDGQAIVASIADNGIFCSVASDFAPEAVTAFTTIAGVKCGVVASSASVNEGRITANSARKISRFVNFCDAFSLPIVTLVDSMGLIMDVDNEKAFFAPEIARLASAYASAVCPKVTVLLDHAIGASFALLGSKALGADIVYALENAEICALPADAGVAFAWDRYITLEKTREELVEEWKKTVSSAAYAASSGEIDDVISTSELRARVCSALLMLCCKGIGPDDGRRILPL